MLTGLAQHVNKIKFLVNENSSTILTGIGVSGTIATAYLTGRASFKAADIIAQEDDFRRTMFGGEDSEEYKEKPITTAQKVKYVWHLYIPAAAVGITTITSIIFANKISSTKIAALTVASGISERALKEYKEKALEKLGVKEDQKIRDEVAQDRVNNYPPGSQVILAGTGEVLCLDMHTGRYFHSSVETIKRAENKINHEINHFMSASLSEFYDEIGLAPTSYTDNVGWDGSSLVDVQFSTVMSPDGRPCLAIDFLNTPHADYNRHHD